MDISDFALTLKRGFSRQDMNIVLVGFMGTGKTAVGKALAGRLGLKYVSTDELIEAREKRAIGEIFAQSGEPYFRRVEKTVVAEVSGRDNLVVDTGGGVVLDEDNVRNLKKTGKMICLEATTEKILERTGGTAHRPLLNVPDRPGEIQKRLEARAPFYDRADHHVDTTALTVDEAATKIIDWVQKHGEDKR